ncbi:hypothetical protein Tco_0898197 [Tanacetum coccineum]
MHTPQRLKFQRKTSFKGRRMILGRSSNGLQTNRKKKLCKADLEDQAFQPLRSMASLTVGLGGRNSISTKHIESSDREASQIADANYVMLNPSAQDRTRQFFTQQSTMWYKKHGDQDIVWRHELGLKVIQTRSTLNVLIGMQPTITSKKTIRSSLSQEQLSIETEIIKETIEKRLRSEGSIESRKRCWRKNKEILTTAVNRTSDGHRHYNQKMECGGYPKFSVMVKIITTAKTRLPCFDVMKRPHKGVNASRKLDVCISSQVHKIGDHHKDDVDYVWTMISRKRKITVKDKR